MAESVNRRPTTSGPNRAKDSLGGLRIYDPPALGQWKGMEFLAISCASSGGRSIAKIAPPYIPGQRIHDLGRKGETHVIKTIWIGDDWRARLENFHMVVSGEATSGELALPDGGTVLTAHVDTWEADKQYEDARDSGEYAVTFVEDSQTDANLIYHDAGFASDGIPPTDTEVHALIDTWESVTNDPDSTPEQIDEAERNASDAITESEAALDTDTVDGVEDEEGYEKARGRMASESEDAKDRVTITPVVG